MPTGYTAAVEDEGQTFPEFLWSCTRAFGVFLHQRDESLGGKLRYPENDGYYAKRYVECAKELEEALLRTDAQWAAYFKKDIELTQKAEKESVAESNKRVANLQAVLDQTLAWSPGEEHKELKKFMIGQLTSSIEYAQPYVRTPDTCPLKERVDQEIQCCRDSLKRARVDAELEVKRNAEARKWIDDLRAQVPVPKSLDGFTQNKGNKK